MRKFKKIFKVIIVILFSSTLISCWDYKDLEEKNIVVSLGVDRVRENIQYVGEISKLRNIGAAGNPIYISKSEGRDFKEARINFNNSKPYKTFLGASKAIVFGQNYAEEGIIPYVNRINKIYDYRKTILTVVSRDPIDELFDIKTKSDLSVGIEIEHMIRTLDKQGQSLYKSVGDILTDVATGDIGYLLPYVGVEEGKVRYLGMAVMKDSKFQGVINWNDSDGVLYLLADKPRIIEDVALSPKHSNIISFRNIVKKRKIKVDYDNDKLKINVYVKLSSHLQYQYNLNIIDKQKLKECDKILERQIKGVIERAIKTSQKYKCDYLNFYKYFKGQHPEKIGKIDWKNQYPYADVNVEISTDIVNKNLKDTESKLKVKD
ncbi:Ger(x)C family spore germination protein [Clostridium oceanicum]|uniref:Ger(X)C family spore germination protein n=1 Tax=Clostridium oceanicum TaxID=1543 RepID=A0ABP3UQM8_9CLOT